MQDFCPLCMKNGARKRIKLLQINLQEAVWACEAEKCTWPFGYEDHIFFPRAVGKIWSCYWDDQKPTVQRIKLEQTDLSSITEGSQESSLIESLDKCKSTIESMDIDTDSKIPIDYQTEVASSNSESTNVGTVNNQAVNDQINNVWSTDEDNVKNTNLELDIGSNSLAEEQEISAQFANGKGVPKITKIEKTNIDVTNIKVEESAELNLTENDVKLPSPVSDLQNQTQFEKSVENIQINSDTPKKSNLNVTTVQIDGLPPITLSYEIPETIPVPETVVSSTPKKHVPTPRRNVSGGRQYEKFSFSALKKKKDCGNTETKTASDSNCSNKNLSFTVKVEDSNRADVTNDLNATTTATTAAIPTTTTATATGTDSVANQDSKLTSDTSLVNSSECIDTVLEGLLTNSYNASADINDEWLNSLLS